MRGGGERRWMDGWLSLAAVADERSSSRPLTRATHPSKPNTPTQNPNRSIDRPGMISRRGFVIRGGGGQRRAIALSTIVLRSLSHCSSAHHTHLLHRSISERTRGPHSPPKQEAPASEPPPFSFHRLRVGTGLWVVGGCEPLVVDRFDSGGGRGEAPRSPPPNCPNRPFATDGTLCVRLGESEGR